MSDEWKTFLMGIFIGMILTTFAASFGTLGTARDVLDKCKESLPRDQTCVLHAIPKTEVIDE